LVEARKVLEMPLNDEAVAELRRAESLAPDMPETLLELGKALSASGDLAGSEPRLRRVLEIEKASSLAEAAHLYLAQLYRKLGRDPEADRELEPLREIRSRRN
jgi:tetratricopeptide (TPR) repeat protein